MTIGKLKGLFNRLFKVDSSDQRLSSVDRKVSLLGKGQIVNFEIKKRKHLNPCSNAREI